MTTREQKAIEICRRLVSEIAAVAPPGASLDDLAWADAAGPADRFITELHRWEEDGDKARLPKLRQLYGDAVAAWQDAGSQAA